MSLTDCNILTRINAHTHRRCIHCHPCFQAVAEDTGTTTAWWHSCAACCCGRCSSTLLPYDSHNIVVQLSFCSQSTGEAVLWGAGEAERSKSPADSVTTELTTRGAGTCACALRSLSLLSCLTQQSCMITERYYYYYSACVLTVSLAGGWAAQTCLGRGHSSGASWRACPQVVCQSRPAGRFKKTDVLI
jgi:hypothetical protein